MDARIVPMLAHVGIYIAFAHPVKSALKKLLPICGS